MTTIRILKSDDFMRPADGEPFRSVVTESEQTTVVAWYVKLVMASLPTFLPMARIPGRFLRAKGSNHLEASGKSHTIVAGDVVLAHAGCVHGV